MAKRGEIWLIDLTPGAYGRETSERRPCIVVSPELLIETTGLAWVVPISAAGVHSRSAGFAVSMLGCRHTTGVAMCEQIRAVDMQSRESRWLENAPQAVIDEILAKLLAVLE